MRKMLNTLFITSEDAYLALENENVVVFRGEEKMGQYPLQILENVVSFSYKGASPALMGRMRAAQYSFMLFDAERTFPRAGLRPIAGKCAPSQNAIPRFG